MFNISSSLILYHIFNIFMGQKKIHVPIITMEGATGKGKNNQLVGAYLLDELDLRRLSLYPKVVSSL